MKSAMMSEGGGGGEGGASSVGESCPTTQQVWLPLPHNDDDDEEEDEEGARGGGAGVGGGGEVVVVGSGGATTLYSREDGATVLEAADGTTTVLRPHGPAHRLTVTVEGGDGEAGEGMTAIVDGQAGTATLVEGAEVVRTQAVSYATPILHHVFLQATSTTPPLHTPPASTTTTSTPRKTPLVAPVILQTASSSVKQDDDGGSSSNSNTTTSKSKSTSTSNTTTSNSSSRSSVSSPSSSSSSVTSKSTKISKCGGDAVKTSTTTATSNASRNTTSKAAMGEDTTTSATTTTTITTTTTTTSTCAKPEINQHHHNSTATNNHHFSHHHLSHLSHLHHHRHPSMSSSPSSTPPPSLSPPSSTSGARTDDELTSLSWLQDSNLLRGTALSPVKNSHGPAGRGGPGEVVKAESPTSDYGDESSDALEPGELTLNDQPHTQPSRQQPIPYNPQVHINAKPPYSFSCLIFMAIEDSSNKALPVKDIYAWILDHFPYFRNAPTGWKNSVRHNLSLNKCFRKVEKAPNLGKGSLWMVDPAYRPNLLQALSKTPFHPYSNLDRIYLVSTKSAFNNKQLGEATSGQGSSATARAASTTVESPVASPAKPAGANVPDPELFPYLARRLGSSGPGALGMEVVGSGVHSEDVDAAAAMLALKHGSRIVTPASESYSQLRDGKDTSLLYEENRRRKRKRKHTEVGDARMMVISSSPSQDHSYTSVDGEEEYPGPTALPPPCRNAKTNNIQAHPPPTKKANHSPTSSVDEAFSDDSYDSDVASEASQADIRQLVEGADALLNLAAVATSLASQRHLGEGVASPAPPNSSPPSNRQNVPRLNQSPATHHLGRVHILKPSTARSATGKNGNKTKGEVAHNNNTILTNNNKVLKVKRFSSRASSRQQLSSSSH